jgi:hypothetical protein
MKATWIALAALVAAAGAGIYFWLHRPSEDCAFSGWSRTVGIEVEAQVQNVKAVQTKVGLTDAQVRDYDQLLKDYALKYDTACRDVNAKRLKPEEYACMRGNMEKVLDDVRKFNQAVEAAKSIADPAAQKAIVEDSLARLHAADSSNYRMGCISSFDINPKRLDFTGSIPERSIFITNRGNRDLTFSVDGYPAGFDPKPSGGKIQPGDTAPVVLLRTIVPVPDTRPLNFSVRTNFQDVQEVEIGIDENNAHLWKTLGAPLASRATSPTMDDALKVVNDAIDPASKISDSDKLELAATVLFDLHADAEASKALDKAAALPAAGEPRPSSLILRGLLAGRKNSRVEANKFFDQAKSAAGPTNKQVESITNVLSASMLVKEGNETRANQVVDVQTAQAVKANPGLAAFAARESCAGKTPCTDQVTSHVKNIATARVGR